MGKGYKIVTVPIARRSLKRLGLPVRNHVVKAVQILIDDPLHGEQLQDPWKFLRSYHTIYRGANYRIVYEANTKQKEIIIWFAAPREKFYRSLRKLKDPRKPRNLRNLIRKNESL